MLLCYYPGNSVKDWVCALMAILVNTTENKGRVS